VVPVDLFKMSIQFTKEEVKEFLLEQGFAVEEDAVLEKFIKDLKKLIKFEEQKKRRQRLGHHPEETVLDTTTEDSSRSRLNETTTSTSSGVKGKRPPHMQHHGHDRSGDPSQHGLPPSRGTSHAKSPRSSKTSPEKVEGYPYSSHPLTNSHQNHQNQRAATSSPSQGSSRKRPGPEDRGKLQNAPQGLVSGDVKDTAKPKAKPSASRNPNESV